MNASVRGKSKENKDNMQFCQILGDQVYLEHPPLHCITFNNKQRFLTPGHQHQGGNDLHSLCRIGMVNYLLNNDDNNNDNDNNNDDNNNNNDNNNDDDDNDNNEDDDNRNNNNNDNDYNHNNGANNDNNENDNDKNSSDSMPVTV